MANPQLFCVGSLIASPWEVFSRPHSYLCKVRCLSCSWCCPAAGSQGDSKKQSATAAGESDDDDWDTGKAGSKKKKGAKRKPAAKQKAGPQSSSQGSKANKK